MKEQDGEQASQLHTDTTAGTDANRGSGITSESSSENDGKDEAGIHRATEDVHEAQRGDETFGESIRRDLVECFCLTQGMCWEDKNGLELG